MAQSFRSSKYREKLSQLLRATDGWISVEHAASVLGLDRRTAAKRLARWAEQGWLRRVQRGHYAPIPLERARADAPLDEPWIAVPHLFPGGYIGGWTAAHHWDLTEQIFRDVCVFAPGRSRRRERAGTSYVVFTSLGEGSYGMRTHWVGSTRALISDPERTLVDMLAQPRSGPGIQHATDCLLVYGRSSNTSLNKLLKFAGRVRNGSVFKRLGFLLERNGIAGPEVLDACRASITQGLAKLDPTVPCPRVVTRWHLRIPDSWVSRDDD